MDSVLLTIDHVTVSFGQRRLFSIPHLALHEGERIGLIGRNGTGKSTLLQLLAGQITPSEGVITRKGRVGYAPQFGQGEDGEDAITRKTFRVRGKGDSITLSGGEQARLRLSRIPFETPILLLDESTANLDAEGQALFANKLRTQSTFLMVSHVRALLCEVCNRIWLLEDGEIRSYNGNYDDFEAARALERQTQLRAHERYTAEMRHLKDAYQGIREHAAQINHAPGRMGNSEARLHKMDGQSAKKLRKIMNGDPAIRITPKAKPGFLCQDLSTLDGHASVLENARRSCIQTETVMRTVLRRLLFPKEVLSQPADTLSGGEKVKLCLCRLILGDCNVLVLDEPTNYLDLPSLRALEEVLCDYPGTLLLVSHDDAFVRHVADRLIRFENGQLVTFEDTPDEYDARRAASPPDERLLRTTLQMRMTQLSCDISAATENKKAALEEEYAQCMAQYRALRNTCH